MNFRHGWLVWGVIPLIAFFGLVTYVEALSLTLTDTTSSVPGTVYNLTITGSGPTYTVTLEAETSNHPGWYIDYLIFHFDQGTNPDLSSPPTAPSSNWNVADKVDQPAVSVLQTGTLPQDGDSALYVNGILTSASPIDVTQGPQLLSNGDYFWSFNITFELNNGGNQTFLNDPQHLQVGYYDGVKTNGGYFFTQMSQDFTPGTPIPEPTTLLLLGSGLLGVLPFVRARLKK